MNDMETKVFGATPNPFPTLNPRLKPTDTSISEIESPTPQLRKTYLAEREIGN